MSRPFDDAIERARGHLRLASVEGLETARALMDAVAIAAGRSEAKAGAASGEIARALDDLIAHLRAGRGVSVPVAIAAPLAHALDREIERWQKRSRSEPEARAVLRAFLSLREILWELGVRVEQPPASTSPEEGAPSPDSAADRPPRAPPQASPPGRARRVQRFDVEG